MGVTQRRKNDFLASANSQSARTDMPASPAHPPQHRFLTATQRLTLIARRLPRQSQGACPEPWLQISAAIALFATPRSADKVAPVTPWQPPPNR